MADAEIHIRAVTFDVSVFPDSMLDDPSSALDADTWKVTIEWRGRDRWAVTRTGRACLSTDGKWEYEPDPSERDEAWLDAHRFSFEQAQALAVEHAPKVSFNGLTALEILARHTGVSHE